MTHDATPSRSGDRETSNAAAGGAGGAGGGAGGDAALVAKCGLYCGACRAYRKGRCRGCGEKTNASWCSVRACCIDGGMHTCAQCVEFEDPMRCGKFNNFIARLFGLIFRSDRGACIRQVRRLGLQGHADAMAAAGAHTIRR